MKLHHFCFACLFLWCLLCSCVATPPRPAAELENVPEHTIPPIIKEEPNLELEPEPEPEPALIVTSEERELLAKLVYREANTESVECQKAVISVVFNRLASGRWGDTINDVVYYPNAFTPATFGLLETARPNETNYEAVDYVLERGSTLPEYVRYFRADYHHSWEGYEGYTVIDSTYFGYFTDWQKGAW